MEKTAIEKYGEFFKVHVVNTVKKGDTVLHTMTTVSKEKFTKDSAREKANWELSSAIQGEYALSFVHEHGNGDFDITFSRGDGLVYITTISTIKFVG
jgi:hypothetical protein